MSEENNKENNNQAQESKNQFIFLVFLIGAMLMLAFFIFRPFLYALILAAIFAAVFQPLYRKIVKFFGEQREVASLATLIIVAIFILTPLTLLGLQISQEAQQLYQTLSGSDGGAFTKALNNVMESLQEFAPFMQDASLDIGQYAKQGVNWVAQNLGSVFSSLAKFLLSIVVFLISLYYLLKDGPRLKDKLMELSPLPKKDNELISKKLSKAVNAVLKGNILIAVIQGAVSSIGFAIFGIPNPLLWGMMAAIGALIPGIGTTIIIVPAIIFLLFTSGLWPAVGLSVWGATAVGLVDNLLGPRFVGAGMQLHPLVVFLAVLGGISFFGPAGFLLGPIAMSLLFALLDIYLSLRKKSEET